MRKLRLLFLALFFPLFLTSALAGDRIPWTMNETYDGVYKDTFSKLRWEVPNFIRQTSIDMAIRIGLNFQEGWSSPMVVQFLDTAPAGVENTLAYVQFQVNQLGEHRQTLNINLTAYERDPFNFQKVFAHELVHAMINDAVGLEGVQNLPLWFHEGLAVYGSEQGEQMLKSYVIQYENQSEDFFLNGLEGPHTALDYMEDYLAFAYIYQEHGITSLQNFVREVVARKGDIPSALEFTCFESWPTFQANFRKYAIQRIKDVKREPRFRGPADKPY